MPALADDAAVAGAGVRKPAGKEPAVLRRYWTNVCQSCAIKPTCTTVMLPLREHRHFINDQFGPNPVGSVNPAVGKICLG
jgi:hypothetical protein